MPVIYIKKERIRILPYRLFVTLTTLHSLPRCTDTLYEYYTKFVRLRQSIQPVSCDVRLMKVLSHLEFGNQRKKTAAPNNNRVQPYMLIFCLDSIKLAFSSLDNNEKMIRRICYEVLTIFLATMTIRPFCLLYSQVDKVISLSPYPAETPVSYNDSSLIFETNSS